MEKLQVLRYTDSDVQRCRVSCWHRCSFELGNVHEHVREGTSFSSVLLVS